MATISLRQVAQQCLGLTGASVNSDVYGYIFRDTDGSVFGTLGANDTLPGSGSRRSDRSSAIFRRSPASPRSSCSSRRPRRRLLWFGQPG